MSTSGRERQRDPIGYIAVAEGSVPVRNRRAAAAAQRFAIRDLRLPPLTIQWFDIAGDGVSEYRWTTLGIETSGGTASSANRGFGSHVAPHPGLVR